MNVYWRVPILQTILLLAFSLFVPAASPATGAEAHGYQDKIEKPAQSPDSKKLADRRLDQENRLDQDDFRPRGRLWSYLFGDIYYKARGESLPWGTSEFAAEMKDTYGARLRRFYLGFDYQFTPEFSSRVLLESAADNMTRPEEYKLFFKEVNLTWEFEMSGLHNTSVSAGLIPTPLFSVPLDEWGYRSVEEEATQVRGFGSSVDQGVSFSGDFDQEENHGFTVMFARGAGRHLESDSYFESAGSVWFQPLANVTFEILGRYQQLNENRARQTLRALVSWQPEYAVIGLSVARGWWINDLASSEGPASDRKPVVVSLYTAFTPFPEVPLLRLFGRLDYHEPHIGYDRQVFYPAPLDFTESLLIAGVHLALSEKLDLMPNLYFNRYHARHDEIDGREHDVIPRLTVFYRF